MKYRNLVLHPNLFKDDRTILQRIIITYEAGRNVHLLEILECELLPVPLSLTEMDGSLRTGQKSILMDELCTQVHCYDQYKVPENQLYS